MWHNYCIKYLYEKKKIKQNKRKICTKETPCDGKGRWAHPDAVLKYDDVDVL